MLLEKRLRNLKINRLKYEIITRNKIRKIIYSRLNQQNNQ